MEVRGPCLVTVHNGIQCNLYEVCTTERSLAGFSNKRYYFDNYEDAQIYTYYLYQVAGVKELKRILRSNKYPNWEKKEYKDFMATLDLTILQELVKVLKPKIESNFVKARGNKNEQSN